MQTTCLKYFGFILMPCNKHANVLVLSICRLQLRTIFHIGKMRILSHTTQEVERKDLMLARYALRFK